MLINPNKTKKCLYVSPPHSATTSIRSQSVSFSIRCPFCSSRNEKKKKSISDQYGENCSKHPFGKELKENKYEKQKPFEKNATGRTCYLPLSMWQIRFLTAGRASWWHLLARGLTLDTWCFTKFFLMPVRSKIRNILPTEERPAVSFSVLLLAPKCCPVLIKV